MRQRKRVKMRTILHILVILQVACALAAFKYSARCGPRPEGPLQAAFKSALGRFVTRITYLSKLIGTPSLAACLKLELFRVKKRRINE
ncbi:hypothetical protein KP22_10050 [Pectobacterium betavasculorum]|uniref:Uncharacterized protein n=1 Tax=Pectobacterium betavasculorum TaxID=55207 RepID=A0A093S7T7_9GAMM|nr:hypothetical protein KP22_10050 [Pectobacterium betavasculorum]